MLGLVAFGTFQLFFIGSSSFVSKTRNIRTYRRSVSFPSDTSNLKECLRREYEGFFDPMEMQFYDSDVTFVDPLTEFTGIEKYKANVDLLAGRTLLGRILFRDAFISLHSVEDTSSGGVRTRWTLGLTMHVLPWNPTAYFSGISDYTLDGNGRVIKQQVFHPPS